MNTDEGMNRRDFLRIAGAGGAVAGMSGTAAAQEGGGKKGGGKKGGGGAKKKGPIDYGGYLESANGWTGQTSDQTGEKQVTVKVGTGAKHHAFGPAAVHVSPGTKVTWKWTGKGSAHNVVSSEDKFKSGTPVAKAGYTYSHTFKKDGIYNYYCKPHKPMGMLGSVAVGKVPHKAPITPKTPAVSNGARTLGVATFISMVSTLGLAYFFIKYGGDYDQ